MRPFGRFLSVVVCTGLMLGASAISFSQTSRAKLGVIKPGYVRMPKININSVQPPSSSIRFALPKGVASTRGMFVNDANSPGGGPHKSTAAHSASNSNIPGLDTVPTFTGVFNSTAPSIDFFQSSDGFTTTANFNMIGNSPLVGGTTGFPPTCPRFPCNCSIPTEAF